MQGARAGGEGVNIPLQPHLPGLRRQRDGRERGPGVRIKGSPRHKPRAVVWLIQKRAERGVFACGGG